MLEARHIMRLMLERARLSAHEQMPPPSYVKKPLTGQFTAIGEAAIGELLGVTPDVFQMQLRAAREFGASYVGEDRNNKVIGVSAATSLIKRGDIMHKNMILPRDLLRTDPRLDAHYVIGVFVRGQVIDGVLPSVSEVEVAGWANTGNVGNAQQTAKPPSFQTKLPIVMVPCTELYPISELVECLSEDNGCV